MSASKPDRDRTIEILGDTPLFRGLGEDDLRALVAIGVAKQHARGEMIFHEGDPSRGFYVVLVGRVKLFKLSPAGKEQILHVHGAGEPFAEAALEEGATYPASATATDPAVALRFPRRAFQQLLGERPVLATNLIARLSHRLRRMTALVEDLSLREAPSRLARYLFDLAGESPAVGAVVTLPMKKGELASLLGTRGETLSRIFRRLFENDVIQVQGSEVRIVDPVRLRMVADGELPGI